MFTMLTMMETMNLDVVVFNYIHINAYKCHCFSTELIYIYITEL